MYVILHELELRIEGIIPNNLHIIDHLTIIFVPVQSLAHYQCESQVHLNCGDELVGHI